MALFDNQGDLTLSLLVRSDPFTNSPEILCMSLFFRFHEVPTKNVAAMLFKRLIMTIFDDQGK